MKKIKQVFALTYLILSLSSLILPGTGSQPLRIGDNYPPVIWKTKP